MRSLATFCIALALSGAWPSLLAAQDRSSQPSGRADLLEGERDSKTKDTVPLQRSVVERALYWYDNQDVFAKLFGGWNGLHLAGGDFPAGAGMKFGVGFSRINGSPADEDRPNRLGVDMAVARSTRGYARAVAAFGVHHVGGAPIDLRIRGQYYDFPQEDFFGLGQSSRTEDRTNYLLESTDAGADLQWKPAKLIDVSGGIAFVSPTVGPGTDARFPSTEELFDESTLPGLTRQPALLRSDASVALDWRDNPQHPHAGGRYGVQFSNFHDRDLDAFGFRRVAIDVQQYVPLPDRYRIVALHAAAVITDPYAGQQVPFFYEPTLGGSQALRGFREFRFRDRNSLLLTAEYRWEASWLLDGALFVDAGKVASERRDLTFRDLDVSYGVGFRVHSNRAFVARFDLAFSREGFIPLMRFEHVF
jgi:hypothetical protein